MKAEGKSQQEIATMLGVDRSTVAKWLVNDVNGHKANDDRRVKVAC